MIGVVDYGVGNVGSLINIYDDLGIDCFLASDAAAIARATRLILPGVGAFDKAMSTLRQRGLIEPLHEAVTQTRTPLLGICLGMQLLARRSEEGQEAGLGWIEADVKRILIPAGSGLKVPHVGWSDVRPTGNSSLFPLGTEVERFYFVHSYHMVCDHPANVAATVEYGGSLCCAVANNNIWGVQFHPEKSHRFGKRLLRTFAELNG